jgi:hypothetical protein
VKCWRLFAVSVNADPSSVPSRRVAMLPSASKLK